MKIDDIIAKAEKLIQIGKKEFLEKEKKTKYYKDSEYHIVYSKAVKVLLLNHNENTRSRINKFFEKNIPKLFKNKDCEESLIQFQNLNSVKLELRISSSKFFRGKAIQETNGFRAILFERPDTFEQLISALKKEENDKVIINLIIALGGAHQRYFKYYDVYDSLSPFFYHKKSDVKYYTIIWTSHIENKNRKETLNILSKQKQAKKVTKVLEEYMREPTKEETEFRKLFGE